MVVEIKTFPLESFVFLLTDNSQRHRQRIASRQGGAEAEEELDKHEEWIQDVSNILSQVKSFLQLVQETGLPISGLVDTWKEFEQVVDLEMKRLEIDSMEGRVAGKIRSEWKVIKNIAAPLFGEKVI